MTTGFFRAVLRGLRLLIPIALVFPVSIAVADQGAVFSVDSTEDAIDANPGDGLCATATGMCALRAAIMETNALATDDRIELGPLVYSLTIFGPFEDASATGDLDIHGNLSIVGQGMTLTGVDAGGSEMGDRAIHVHSDASLTLEGVSVINAHIGAGANGAGLLNDEGRVVIRASSFQWNQAHNGAGLMNAGEMSLEQSLIGDNVATDSGAGLRNDGTLEIDRSSILNNQTASGPGGGIENHGFLVLRNSTVSGNRAGYRSAAIYNGYGPLGTGASLSINNTTIYSNLVESGGGDPDATGGILNEPASYVLVSNTILAWNAVDAAYSDCRGTITSGGYNLFGTLDGCLMTGDLFGNVVAADPLLGAAEEDPAHTVSHPLLPGSPAINAGSPAQAGSGAPACEAIDQRGVARPQGDACDIGAYETEDVPMPTPPPASLFFDGFESGGLSAWSSAQTDQGDLSVAHAAALGGEYGLQAEIDDNRSLFVVDKTPSNETAYAARFYFDPNGIMMASGNAHVLFKAMDAASRTAFQVELRSFQGDYQVRAYAPWDSGGAYSTPWFRLNDDIHLLEAIWQAASDDGASDGWLSLWVDGEFAASGSGLNNDTRRVDTVRLGAVSGIDSDTRGTYFFDAFGSTAGGLIGPDTGIALPQPSPAPDEVFADGFETGSLSSWSAFKHEADLVVNSVSALVGDFGLEALVDDTSARYVTDWSPGAEKEYRVRFVCDPNSLTMLNGRSHIIFQALTGSSKDVARVELRYKSLNYELRSGILTDNNQWVNTGWWYIPDDLQVIELDWRAATSPDSADGGLTMWINEVQSESRAGVQNHTLQVDFVRLGLVAGVDSGTLGSMYFDAFESRRQSYIGLPDAIATPQPTGTGTVTVTETATSTPTLTETPTPTFAPTDAPTGTATVTGTMTVTPTMTPTP